MPWDTEGHDRIWNCCIYKNLSELQVGDQLIFEDLAGTQYHYQYIQEKSEEVIDHGIQIISSDKNIGQKQKTTFQFKFSFMYLAARPSQWVRLIGRESLFDNVLKFFFSGFFF